MAKIVVVGDRFAQFSENDKVLTFTQAKKFFLDNKNDGSYQIVIGQGLSKNNIETFLKDIGGDNVDIESANSCLPLLRETTLNTHKENEENVLISESTKLDKKVYQCHLLIDDGCAEMSDHVTGQHIQGMVLLEACRQMVNSVSERYLIKTGYNKSFVLHAMNSEFLEYLFPVTSTMELTLRKYRKGLRGDFTAECTINVIQNDKICLTTSIKFSAVDKGSLNLIEQQMAEKSLNYKH